MKLRATPCRATQGGWVVLKSSDKMWVTGEGNGKPRQYFCLENLMDCMKKQKDMMPEDGCPRLEGVQYATGEVQREVTKSFRKNEAAGPEWERCSAGDAEIIMRNARLDESQAVVKIVGRNINNLRYADDTTLTAESKEELNNI